jgi:D-sedoheptulose 7-phosphate isomerase
VTGTGTPPELAQHAQLLEHVAAQLPALDAVADRTIAAFAGGGRVYAFGNGGSATQAQHLVGELTGRYKRDRRPLPALALSADPALLTCIANDYSFEDVFARQLEAFAGKGDLAVGFTTSGRSPNVVRGLETARQRGATTVLFGGGDGVPAADHADHALVVPSSHTARVQEMHLLLLHLLAERVDAWAAGEVEA